jgi:hypothetical protein
MVLGFTRCFFTLFHKNVFLPTASCLPVVHFYSWLRNADSKVKMSQTWPRAAATKTFTMRMHQRFEGYKKMKDDRELSWLYFPRTVNRFQGLFTYVYHLVTRNLNTSPCIVSTQFLVHLDAKQFRNYNYLILIRDPITLYSTLPYLQYPTFFLHKSLLISDTFGSIFIIGGFTKQFLRNKHRTS